MDGWMDGWMNERTDLTIDFVSIIIIGREYSNSLYVHHFSATVI